MSIKTGHIHNLFLPHGPTSGKRVALILACGTAMSSVTWVFTGSFGTATRAYAAEAPPPRSEFSIRGMVRDFQSSHPDFGVTDPSQMGQTAMMLSGSLGPNDKPQYLGYGREVTDQWFDRDGKQIKPYGDPGLVGGHFDVDVYDELSSSETYHEHEFDDKFDVDYVDIANDSNLLFDDIIGRDYPNPIRVTFSNLESSGGGTYVFHDGTNVYTGLNENGLNRTFMAADLVELEVKFESLYKMRGTSPGTSQDDVADRDSAFRVLMYDTVTNEMVYELATYAHVKGGLDPSNPPPVSPDPMEGDDACGNELDDTTGTFSGSSTGGVASANSFGQWFDNVPGVNTSSPHEIALQRDEYGVYSYRSDEFFPIDGAGYGNEGFGRNSNFTYSFSAFFNYNACQNEFFEFEASDDLWVFINGELVIDLGGTSTGTTQYVALDRLGLEDGSTIKVDLFYANRRDEPTSTFGMRTNVQMPSKPAQLPSNALYD